MIKSYNHWEDICIIRQHNSCVFETWPDAHRIMEETQNMALVSCKTTNTTWNEKKKVSLEIQNQEKKVTNPFIFSKWPLVIEAYSPIFHTQFCNKLKTLEWQFWMPSCPILVTKAKSFRPLTACNIWFILKLHLLHETKCLKGPDGGFHLFFFAHNSPH